LDIPLSIGLFVAAAILDVLWLGPAGMLIARAWRRKLKTPSSQSGASYKAFCCTPLLHRRKKRPPQRSEPFLRAWLFSDATLSLCDIRGRSRFGEYCSQATSDLLHCAHGRDGNQGINQTILDRSGARAVLQQSINLYAIRDRSSDLHPGCQDWRSGQIIASKSARSRS
jgi:hypothetical protein